MKKTYSILRLAQEEQISKVQLGGRVLDIGGDKRSGYQSLLQGDISLHTINIDEKYQPDDIVDIEKKFPYVSGEFDHCVCFNVLEHIFETQHVFAEMVRVTKVGGKIVVTTPFLYNIHGSPDDFQRYTDSYYRRLAEKNKCTIELLVPLGSGFFSVGYAFICGWFPTYILKQALRVCATSLDGFLAKISRRYRALSERLPMGYFVVFTKVGGDASSVGS